MKIESVAAEPIAWHKTNIYPATSVFRKQTKKNTKRSTLFVYKWALD